MKALILCQSLGVGGAEELIRGQSSHLGAEGVDAGVVALTRRGPIADEIAMAGVPVHFVPGEPGPRDPRAFVRLVRLLRRERPDVVHTYLMTANLYGRLAALAAGVPVVIAAEQNVYERKPRKHALMERALATRTYRVVACCRAVGDFYQRQVGLTSGKIEVIYNAVRFGPLPTERDRAAARAALGLPADGLVLGTLGRLTEQKGHSVLLRALSALRDDVPNARLFIAGRGPLHDALQAEAVSLGIADRVHLLGMRRDRDNLLAAMDVFVLPSRWEGLSLALVEAMGAGRAVVATTVGGNPEVVTHERTGLLVPPEAPDALAEAICRLASDHEARLALGQAAAEDARSHFAIGPHVARIAALYRRGLAERGRLPVMTGAAT